MTQLPRLLFAIALCSLLLVSVTPAAGQALPAVHVGYEAARDEFEYRFDNRSSFEGGEIVPHRFVQTYQADNHWLVAGTTFRAGGRRLESMLAVTPQRTTRGDDFDTFFASDGDVVVSGTTGNVSLRSWRLRQTVSLGRAGGLLWHIGYKYRRDRSVFHPGLKIVTHTSPPSRQESLVTTRETTLSNVHEVLFGAGKEWRRGRWQLEVDADVAPTTNARLTTQLPDKYPGKDLVFTAIVATVSPTVTLTRVARRSVAVSLSGTRTFSYVESRQFARAAVAAAVRVDLPF